MIESLGEGEEAGAFALGYHCAGRTAEVQIDLLVAHLMQLPCRVDKGFGIISKQLRNQRKSFILLRFDIPAFLIAERPGCFGSEERGIVAIHPGEKFLMGAAVETPRDSLH